MSTTETASGSTADSTGTDSTGAGSRPDLTLGDDGRTRCSWSANDAEYRRYHDEEWGTPQHDSRALYEKMCLEGFQAGLSWITILRRRPAFREVFHGFRPEQVAAMTEDDVQRLLSDKRIIRHRGKIEASIANARVLLDLDIPLNQLMWSFAPASATACNPRPHKAQTPAAQPPASQPPEPQPSAARQRRPQQWRDVPAHTPESTAMSTELRRRGFRFVGPTTMYALMQATGMVDDHLEGCFRAGDVCA